MRPKQEIREWFKRFWADRSRGVSAVVLCDFLNIGVTTFGESVLRNKMPMSNAMQATMSKFIHEWEIGRIEATKNRWNGSKLQYRREPKVELAPTVGLRVVDGQIRLKVGLQNRRDYSGTTLKEQLNGSRP